MTLMYDLMLMQSCYTGSEPIVDPHASTARTLQLGGIWHQAISDVTEVASEGRPSRRRRGPSFRHDWRGQGVGTGFDDGCRRSRARAREHITTLWGLEGVPLVCHISIEQS